MEPVHSLAARDREALIHLLMDHSRLVEALRQAGQVQIRDGD